MTFAELAKSRGISKLSAAALVRRHGWRRQRDNRGRVIALVPADGPELRRAASSEADNPPDDQPDYPPDNGAFESALAAIEAAHAGEIAALRAQADGSEQGRLAMQALADRLSVQLADAGERTERLARDLAGAIAAADQARSEAQRAREQAEALRTTVDELRVGQGRLQAEAEGQRIAAETARAALERAHAEAQEAEEAATALRQAEETRKARGRLRRAWDGWRGR